MKIFRIVATLLVCFLVTSPTFALDSGVESLRQTGNAFASVARSVSPSVVFVQVESHAAGPAAAQIPLPFGDKSPFGDDLFKRFFGDQYPGTPRDHAPQRQPHAIGQGSGFIFKSRDGLLSDRTYILTNNHVVENAEKIRVKLQDGREFEAKLTGTDPKSDVAVIEIRAGGLPALALGDSAKLEVGEWVVAIGNPFGLSNTLTVGVVSAKGRTGLGINDYEDFIQTDAAINPGNSGGPLVNLDGEAIGINTAIFSRSGGYMGVGFTIPINLARNIAQQLIDQGEVTRGYLGIMIQELTPELAESFKLKQTQGILVAQVMKDSPAEKAGLKQGDVIVGYQDKPVADVGDFRNRIALTQPGSREPLTVLRNGKSMMLELIIGKLNKDELVTRSDTGSNDKLGVTVQTVTPQLAEQFGLDSNEGVVVTGVESGSIAALAGIKVGTVILQVNQKPVNNAAEFTRVVSESSAARRVLLLIRSGNMQSYVALNW